jgi:hypothetical protein
VGVCRNYKGYEEVRVPGIRHKLPDEAMVQVASMPDWAQLAFHGYKYGPSPPPGLICSAPVWLGRALLSRRSYSTIGALSLKTSSTPLVSNYFPQFWCFEALEALCAVKKGVRLQLWSSSNSRGPLLCFSLSGCSCSHKA